MENVNNMEIFKDIKGYPNYQISNKGRIWSKYQNRYKATAENNKGYLQVNLKAINGKWKHELVHRLVALAFIDNPTGLPEVNHKDSNRQNNNVENLEWVSRKENIEKSSLPQKIEVYDKQNNLVGCYDSIRQACKELNLTESNVSACLSPKCAQKTHKGYHFIKK